MTYIYNPSQGEIRDDEDGELIATVDCGSNRVGRVLAAAPDLLSAALCAIADLQGLCQEMVDGPPDYIVLTVGELGAAIAKAQGDES